MILSSFIGDKRFYKTALSIAVPIMVQEGITNFVGLLDNIMVGRMGTVQMSGVAIVNLLMFVFNLTIFGALAGAGLFGAQFCGADDVDGVRNTLRFKVISSLFLTAVGTVVFLFFGRTLVSAFLNGGSGTQNSFEVKEATLDYAEKYLRIMLYGLPPLALSMAYSTTLRETGETLLPMKASFASVFVNLVGNYLLIFGNFGFPKLGVQGAAIATVVSRYVQASIEIIWTHTHLEKNSFARGLYSTIKIPFSLAVDIVKKGWPLMINEFMWASGITMLNQCFSVRGLSVVAAMNITDTIGNLFNIVFIAMGNTVGVIVGQILGSGDYKKARDTDNKLIAFSVGCCIIFGSIMAALAPVFPKLYVTEDEVRKIAVAFILSRAVCLPLGAFLNACYFTLRAGGNTFITFVFDSLSVWLLAVPIAFSLSRWTSMPIIPLYLIVALADVVKAVIGFVLVKKGTWIKRIV